MKLLSRARLLCGATGAGKGPYAVAGRNGNDESSGAKSRISVKTSGEVVKPEKEQGLLIPETGIKDQSDLGNIPLEEKINTLYRLTNGLAQQMEKSRIAEYTELLHSPWRLIWLNIFSGAARGLGIALGFTFFAATIIYVLQVLGALNLPIIGDYIADIVRIVQHQLELKTF